MTRPRLLDLFCCAGGAAMGYHRAGFDVTGVDINPQPRYPFTFVQADALEYLAAHGHEYNAWHGSPPCHDHSILSNAVGLDGTGWLLAATREGFASHPAHRPWVIENVPGAPMRSDFRLCGCMFGLPGLRRERWFETSWRAFALRPPCHHTGRAVTVSGHGAQGREYANGTPTVHADHCRAMGIDWMTRDELSQAIPPAYTEVVGSHLLEQLVAARGAA
jgi:DNA (cytosine-5)-methyltransferase 1